MNRPFFSICIAAYDAQRFIDECLESILAQDCHDYEVIIVDDGSLQPLVLDKAICTLLPSCKLHRQRWALRSAANGFRSRRRYGCPLHRF